VSASKRIFDAARTHNWVEVWVTPQRVEFRKGDRLVSVTFTEHKLHPATARALAPRVVGGYRTVDFQHSSGTGTLAFSGRDKAGQIVAVLNGTGR
jgi:hypothetical protein